MKATGEWKEITLKGKAPIDVGPGEWKAAFNLAYGKGTIEISDIKLTSN